MRLLPYILVFSFLIAPPQLFASTEGAQEAIHPDLCERIEQLFAAKHLSIQGEVVSASRLVSEFYEARDFRFAWRDKNKVNELIAEIRASEDEGLNPRDYHLVPIEAMLEAYHADALDQCDQADFDILLTDALSRLIYHYLYGKVDPGHLDPNWNLETEILGENPVKVIQKAIDARSLSTYLLAYRPSSPMYNDLKKALALYRDVASKGGWTSIPGGPNLKRGMEDHRVPAIRRRLVISGDMLPSDAMDSIKYDGPLAAAVKRFQKRHILESDGILGEATLSALNIPIDDKINQIRVNMERLRWVHRELPDEYLIVDIAGFWATIYKDNKVLWTSAIQVGEPFRETPVFKDELQYLVFNPTWTVPPIIFKEDVLPKLQKDLGYLDTKNLNLIDYKGRPLDPTNIDWNSVDPERFPHMLRQMPGPDNALGRIKFMFPNEHAVYLHDTPSRANFKKAQRAFSSGCIRVQKAHELAELLLNDPANWSQDAIQEVIDEGETKNVLLKKRMPIFLMYLTFGVQDKTHYFKPDVYSRDPAVLAALDEVCRLNKLDKPMIW